MMTLFSKEEINTTRQWSFDAAKFVAILFMVLVHTFIYVYGEENMNYGFQYRLNNIYGGVFAAPVFMFCMGVGVAYSRRSDSKTMFIRGVKLLLVGYLLNMVRSLPQLLLWLQGYGNEHYESFLEELAIFDILQFAGIAFFLFSLLHWLKASPNVVLLTGIALSIFGTYVRSVDMGSSTLNLLCYSFVGIHVGNIWTSFPLANWFIFVATGYWFGKLIRRCNDLDRFYALLMPSAGFIFSASIAFMTTHSVGMFTENNDDFFYYLTTIDSLVCIMGAFVVIGIGHFVMPHEPQRIKNIVKQVSTDVTRIYLIHWMFISYLISGLLMGVFGIDVNKFLLIIIALVILYISAWLACRKPFSLINI